ncbi:catalase-2 [Plutella xylostella]|uniref:catalase-2 n=1 Tax=Plutella xylostella TaxID=51655 RepID=UPI002032B00F|nr:catalase-2 [Plutella xylostella]
MRGIARALCVVCVVGLARPQTLNSSDANVDPVSRQLFDYRWRKQRPDLLTISSGEPVYFDQTVALNSVLLNNRYVVESLQHAVNERTPDREVFAKGTGAHGYFEVTNDVTKYTKAKLFEKVGKRSRILVRLSVSQGEKGTTDLNPVAGKGFSVRFYTEEGNFDLLGLNTPVYFYKDPTLFREFVHAFRPNPKTFIRDGHTAVDFVTFNPVSLHTILWQLSEYGLPRGFRHMHGFPCHTYELYNEHGESYFVKFKFIAELGFDSFSLLEASTITSFDPDFFIRDLYNSIENKNYPAWRFEMDVLNTSDLRKLKFDPFDVARLWPNGTYTTVEIGRLVLNQNVKNQFAEVEQAAFNPTNLVPGIIEPPDQLFRGRVIAYNDAQIHRLGINRNKININCPMYAKTYNRDGIPPTLDNEGVAVNYYRNSFNGPIPLLDIARPRRQLIIEQSSAVDLQDCWRFYNEVLVTDAQKQRLVNAVVMVAIRVKTTLQKKLVRLLRQVNPKLAARFVATIDVFKKTVRLPQVVEEINRTNPNPFSNVTMS